MTMKQLTTQQRQKIKACYQRHWLYSHLYSPAKEMERRLSTLRISPEELFVECMGQLDLFLDDPEAYLPIGRSLYDDYYCELRERGNLSTTEKEVERGSVELCFVLNYLFSAIEEEILAISVTSHLTESLINYPETYAELSQWLEPKLWVASQTRFFEELGRYVDAKPHLSATIEKQLMEWNEGPSTSQVDEKSQSEGEIYSNRQVVILFQELLNISLSAEDTNIKELARYIHKVTGRNVETIRTNIKRLNKAYDVSNIDINRITKDLEQFSPELAKAIRARYD